MGRAHEPKYAKGEGAPGAAAVLAGQTVDRGTRDANGSSTTRSDASDLAELLSALQAMRAGDFSVRISGKHDGIAGKVADTFNDIVAANERMSRELERVGEVVGREGRTRHRVKFGLAS